MVLEFGFAGALSAASLLGYAVRGRSATLLAPSDWRGPSQRKALALTFDDGPSETTPELLEILESHQARCTFFQIGRKVERLPEIARRVRAGGHEIGNHSYSHSNFCFRAAGFMEDELQLCQDAIAQAVGIAPTLFRAPYGCRWFGLGAAQNRQRLHGVMWTTIARDWTLDAKGVYRRMKRGSRPGAILCLHDGRELQLRPDIRSTTESMRRLLPDLREQGYQLVTVSELLCRTPHSNAPSA